MTRSPLHKTEWCTFYWRSHGCRWGHNCNHAHSWREYRGDGSGWPVADDAAPVGDVRRHAATHAPPAGRGTSTLDADLMFWRRHEVMTLTNTDGDEAAWTFWQEAADDPDGTKARAKAKAATPDLSKSCVIPWLDLSAARPEPSETGSLAGSSPDGQQALLQCARNAILGNDPGGDKADHPGDEAADDPGDEAPAESDEAHQEDDGDEPCGDKADEDVRGLLSLAAHQEDEPCGDPALMMGMCVGYFAGAHGAHGLYINYLNQRGGVSQRASFAQVGAIIDRPHGSYPGCRK